MTPVAKASLSALAAIAAALTALLLYVWSLYELLPFAVRQLASWLFYTPSPRAPWLAVAALLSSITITFIVDHRRVARSGSRPTRPEFTPEGMLR